jgi:hypothetical protein
MNRKNKDPLSLRSHPILSHPWTPAVLALLAGLVFLIQAVIYAHVQDVTMDEGTYLMKGLLYVRGEYSPFQQFGPWTNKLPLAFYIPGLAQAIFEPGLRTGRYFSIFLAMIMLLGLWLVSRRLAGRWAAAAILWIMAASSANIMYYSWAVSQVIVACLLTWSLALTLGRDRPIWQLMLGAILAVLVVLTRQNMLPVIPLLLLYIFWQHGVKAGGYATAASAAVFLIVHAVFWPEIWVIWRPWLPGFMRSWVDIGRGPGSLGASFEAPQFSPITKLYVFWEGFRFNFFMIAGAVTSWILWPRRRAWKSDEYFKIAVFLSVLLVILIASHYWAAAFKDYCMFCYAGYLAFFAPAGLLLPAVSYSSWKRSTGWMRSLFAAVFITAAAAGTGFGAYKWLSEPILNITIPRITNKRIIPGTTQLWRSLSNKFDLSFDTLQQLLPGVAGFIFGLLFIAAVAFIVIRIRRKQTNSLAYILLSSFMLLGILLTPTLVLSGDRLGDLCGWDVIASHERVGQQLAEQVPAGSRVYWQNDLSPLPLLYIPGITIYPAQLNHFFNFRDGGDANFLVRYGFWNEALQRQWLLEADYALIADPYVVKMVEEGFITKQQTEVGVTPPTVPCRNRSLIHIFRRIP